MNPMNAPQPPMGAPLQAAPMPAAPPAKKGGGVFFALAGVCFVLALGCVGMYLLQDYRLGKVLDEETALEKEVDESLKGKHADEEGPLRDKLKERIEKLKKQADDVEIVDHHLLENSAAGLLLVTIVFSVVGVVKRKKKAA